MKITDKMRRDWLMREDTSIYYAETNQELANGRLRYSWTAYSKYVRPESSWRSKQAAVDKAIRAELKAKEKR